jgi:hypothetical protein
MSLGHQGERKVIACAMISQNLVGFLHLVGLHRGARLRASITAAASAAPPCVAAIWFAA